MLAIGGQPGQDVRVEIELPWRRFAHWDISLGDWVVEPGSFEVRVGTSVSRILATHSVMLGAPS